MIIEVTADLSLIEINLSGNNLVIESSAFYDDKYLKNVTFGAGIKSIGSNAFYNCLSISELNFFDGFIVTHGKTNPAQKKMKGAREWRTGGLTGCGWLMAKARRTAWTTL